MQSWFSRFRTYITTTFQSLSFLEKSFVVVLCVAALISVIGILSTVHTKFTTVVPAPGGVLHEGIVGTPRFINPLLAQTDADKTLTTLLYAGLMRALPGGKLIPDIAESYAVSPDGTQYTFTLREDAVFHDNTPITAHDVVFTVHSIQDPRIASPRMATWDGVSVDAPNERTVVFTLSRPYSGFLNNTMLGILPSHIWEEVAADDFRGSLFNERPVGAGPFMMEDIRGSKNGEVEAYVLRPFSNYTLGKPFLTRIFVHIFGNEKGVLDAYENDDIESFRGSDPFSTESVLDTDGVIRRYPLPRTFGLFLNHNRNAIFTHEEVRKAVSYAVDREEIIATVLNGLGTPTDTPIPQYLYSHEIRTNSIANARAILENSGWSRSEETGVYEKKDETLSFSIKTINSPELKLVAEMLQKQINDLGAEVTVELFDLAQLNQNVIRSRDYDALLFGQVLSRDGDLYPFWHSSQRNDPGLNVALYTSSQVDAILDELRTTLVPEERATLYESFVDEWISDTPAIFLYIPDMAYVVPKKIQGITEGPIQDQSERFLDVHLWYIDTQRVFTFLR